MKIGVRALFGASSGNRALTPIFLVLLSACSMAGHAPKDDPQFAGAIADTAAQAAVAKRGARVCREMQVGIAERDWVRGVVVAADGAMVDVRVDEPGRYAHTVNGAQVRKGATVRDRAAAWIPCLGDSRGAR